MWRPMFGMVIWTVAQIVWRRSREYTSAHSIASLTCLAVDLFALPTPALAVGWSDGPTVNCRQPGFFCCRPRIWNNLPADVKSAELLSTFCQRLKTHLFSKSFPGYFPAICRRKRRLSQKSATVAEFGFRPRVPFRLLSPLLISHHHYQIF